MLALEGNFHQLLYCTWHRLYGESKHCPPQLPFACAGIRTRSRLERSIDAQRLKTGDEVEYLIYLSFMIFESLVRVIDMYKCLQYPPRSTAIVGIPGRFPGAEFSG